MKTDQRLSQKYEPTAHNWIQRYTYSISQVNGISRHLGDSFFGVILFLHATSSNRANLPECEIDRSPPFNADIKNAWRFASIPHMFSWHGA
jgi:hypothetical protein